jgi:2-polyprenyl-3-methyl-5-hydroxy-6-metoxy-1,4-benzoquinol methylase
MPQTAHGIPTKADRPPAAPDRSPAAFSGTQKFTGYMRKIAASIQGFGGNLRILDVPAGFGQFTDALRSAGHDVTPADISGRRDDFVYADMNGALPFDDGAFDVVICLEGIEHVIDPTNLIGELIRVARPGGRIYLSTPNVMNFHSRLQFLFTGTFHQFSPYVLRDVPRGVMEDRGHIMPISYVQVRTLAEYHGGRVIDVMGDRFKRKALMPLYGALWLLGRPWAWRLKRHPEARGHAARNAVLARHLNRPALLFSRSMIVVMEKSRGDRAGDERSDVDRQGAGAAQLGGTGQ